jgi:tetraacyldisaccharide 4'-kinase
VSDGVEFPLELLREAPVSAACGIANPEAFFGTLEALGARLAARTHFPDHHPVQLGAVPNAPQVVVTEKDAVRMDRPPDHVFALKIELVDFPLP